MKKIKLSQILRSAAKKSTLLVVALLSFQVVASKMPTGRSNYTTRKQPAFAQESSTVEEKEGYKKTVITKPLIGGQTVQASIEDKITRLQDGTILQITTTVEPRLQDGIIVTTIEEFRKYDYEKVLNIGTDVAVHLADVAYQNRDKIFNFFDKGRRAAAAALQDALKDQGSLINSNDALIGDLLGQYLNS